jgi:hypothetical protein
VKRTSGFSEEGIPPSNEKDDDYKNDPVFKFGTRISEKRLNSAKSTSDRKNKKLYLWLYYSDTKRMELSKFPSNIFLEVQTIQ